MTEKEWIEQAANKFGEILLIFPIYYHLWEVDGYGCIVKTPEGHKLITTNHGRAYIADKKELEDKLEEYETLRLETEKALSLLD